MKRSNRIILNILSIALVISFFLDKIILNITADLNNLTIIEFIFSTKIIILSLIAISIYFYKTKEKLILPLWISAIFSTIMSMILKLIIRINRPFSLEKFYPLGIPNFSFPSTHATIVFSILPIVLKHKNKKLIWVWIIYASLTAISRILLKQHHLSDVIGGALLGLGIGFLIVNYYPKIKKKFK